MSYGDQTIETSARLGRKESRTICPICRREPGATHNDFCPRSMIQLKLRPKSRPRIAYLSKGVDVATDAAGEQHVVRNPGFPMVNTSKVRKDGKKRDWTAGGLPLRFDRESAQDFMREQASRPLSDFAPKKETLDDSQRPESTTPSQDPQGQGAGEPNQDG